MRNYSLSTFYVENSRIEQPITKKSSFLVGMFAILYVVMLGSLSWVLCSQHFVDAYTEIMSQSNTARFLSIFFFLGSIIVSVLYLSLIIYHCIESKKVHFNSIITRICLFASFILSIAHTLIYFPAEGENALCLFLSLLGIFIVLALEVKSDRDIGLKTISMKSSIAFSALVFQIFFFIYRFIFVLPETALTDFSEIGIAVATTALLFNEIDWDEFKTNNDNVEAVRETYLYRHSSHRRR